MNPALAKLLFSASNIVCPNDRLFLIDMEEWTKLLDMDSGIKFPSVGDWVTVCRGLYKGDVGYILSVENWGQVTLLLIPRPPPPPEVGPSSGKGKRKQSGTCSNPAMFTWEVLDNVLLTHSITQYKQEDDGTKMTYSPWSHFREQS